MNSRLRELANAFRSLVDACAPVKQAWKVKYLKKVPTGLKYRGKETYEGKWTVEVVAAFNREEAAEIVDPKLRPGYNCLVTKVMPGEVEEYEGMEVME